MFISPGEIARGQWLIPHSPIEKEKTFGQGEEVPFGGGLFTLLTGGQMQEQPTPHLVLAVQLPFIVVTNCLTQPAMTLIWRTDEKNYIEVKADFMQSYDPGAFQRGNHLLMNQWPQPKSV